MNIIILQAANRGAVQLPADQAYLQAAPLERNETKVRHLSVNWYLVN